MMVAFKMLVRFCGWCIKCMWYFCHWFRPCFVSNQASLLWVTGYNESELKLHHSSSFRMNAQSPTKYAILDLGEITWKIILPRWRSVYNYIYRDRERDNELEGGRERDYFSIWLHLGVRKIYITSKFVFTNFFEKCLFDSQKNVQNHFEDQHSEKLVRQKQCELAFMAIGSASCACIC